MDWKTPFKSGNRTVYEEDAGLVICGSSLQVLRNFPADSIQCCVCSPPYWCLRVYSGVHPEVWGGAPNCPHEWEGIKYKLQAHSDDGTASGLVGGQQHANCRMGEIESAVCYRCGAWTGQLGLEPQPEMYVEHLVMIFEEVRRVLRSDGVLWVNLSDSYAGGKTGRGDQDRNTRNTDGRNVANASLTGASFHAQRPVPVGLKPKDLCMIPAMVAIALRNAGWYLRSECVWNKPNCLPESVTDRPTRSHEMIYLFSKSQRYYYDSDAIRESFSEHTLTAYPNGPGGSVPPAEAFPSGGVQQSGLKEGARAAMPNPMGRNRRSVWTFPTRPNPMGHFAAFPPELPQICIEAGSTTRACPTCGSPWHRVSEKKRVFLGGSGRAGRSAEDANASGKFAGAPKGTGEQRGKNIKLGPVVSKTTTGWVPGCGCGASEDLSAEDLEIIGTPTGYRVGEDDSMKIGRAGFARPRGNSEGSRPITRYEQRTYAEQLRNSTNLEQMRDEAGPAFDHYVRTDKSGGRPIPEDLLNLWIERGWIARVSLPEFRPLDPVPGIVLDPFGGTGTTAQIARLLGRRYISIEISEEYCGMHRTRFEDRNRVSKKDKPIEGQRGLFDE